MLARSSTLLHRTSGVKFPTPLLVPSFSSKGFKTSDNPGHSETSKILTTTAEFLTQYYLVSAYDIYYGHIPEPSELPFKPELIFVDSGGYEVSDEYDFSVVSNGHHPVHEWNVELLRKVLDAWPDSMPAVLVSYDNPKNRKPFLDQVHDARALFSGRTGHLHTFLIKPEKKDQTTLENALKAVMANTDELSSFDIIGVTEKELGHSMLDRMAHIAKLRLRLTDAGINSPIHVFGALDPLSVCLYFISGAEIFDGLTWIRYGYSEGRCVYPHNFGVIEYGIQARDDFSKSRMMVNNYYYLDNLQLKMQEFVSTGDFSKLAPHSELIRNAIDSLNTRLHGGAK